MNSSPPPAADGALHQQREGERADEDAQHQLVAAVRHELAQHARRELAGGELESDDGDREDDAGDGDDAAGDGLEHALRALGAAAEQPPDVAASVSPTMSSL
jgi:hypothetical protein